MSRVAKSPVDLPAGVDVVIAGQDLTVKGKNGSLSLAVNDAVVVSREDNQLVFAPKEGAANGWTQAGTARSLVNNMVVGVSIGFERKLQLVGVGSQPSREVTVRVISKVPADVKLCEGF